MRWEIMLLLLHNNNFSAELVSLQNNLLFTSLQEVFCIVLASFLGGFPDLQQRRSFLGTANNVSVKL